MNTSADITATVPVPVEGHSFAHFLAALRHSTRFLAASADVHPLNAAVDRIETNPAFMQSRLLTRVVTALNTRQGEFRPAEISVFDSETLRLIVALMNAREAGTFTAAEWLSAVERMHAAQLAPDA